mmetsp:Transcript_37914/g.63768  ORF Transcript_37914/g.63768 Transcript_37914/m.63768 type:complete len:359 (-) Transcript_37914:932-2008(-)
MRLQVLLQVTHTPPAEGRHCLVAQPLDLYLFGTYFCGGRCEHLVQLVGIVNLQAGTAHSAAHQSEVNPRVPHHYRRLQAGVRRMPHPTVRMGGLLVAAQEAVLDAVEGVGGGGDAVGGVVVEVDALVQVFRGPQHYEAVDDQRVEEIDEERDLGVEGHLGQVVHTLQLCTQLLERGKLLTIPEAVVVHEVGVAFAHMLQHSRQCRPHFPFQHHGAAGRPLALYLHVEQAVDLVILKAIHPRSVHKRLRARHMVEHAAFHPLLRRTQGLPPRADPELAAHEVDQLFRQKALEVHHPLAHAVRNAHLLLGDLEKGEEPLLFLHLLHDGVRRHRPVGAILVDDGLDRPGLEEGPRAEWRVI